MLPQNVQKKKRKSVYLGACRGVSPQSFYLFGILLFLFSLSSVKGQTEEAEMREQKDGRSGQ